MARGGIPDNRVVLSDSMNTLTFEHGRRDKTTLSRVNRANLSCNRQVSDHLAEVSTAAEVETAISTTA